MKIRKVPFNCSMLMLAAMLCQCARADEPIIVVDDTKISRASGAFAVFNSLDITLRITADEVASARSVMTAVISATDESGQSLMGLHSPDMIWRDVHQSPRKPSVSGYIDLKSPPRADKTVCEITGRVEFYDPVRDPQSIVTITDIDSHIGQALNNPILKAAGLEFIYLDKAHLNAYQKTRTSNPALAKQSKVDKDINDFLIGALNEDETTLALISKNVRGRLVDIQIETAEGQILGKRLVSITPELLTFQYREKIPTGVRIKIYVATPKSVTKVPFKLTDVALP